MRGHQRGISEGTDRFCTMLGQEFDYESGGVPVATTTAGEDDSRIVMDGLGVSMAPGQDEGHTSVAAGAHSEVTVDGICEVADAGEILLPQQVTSSAPVQVPPLMVYPKLQMLVRSC